MGINGECSTRSPYSRTLKSLAFAALPPLPLSAFNCPGGGEVYDETRLPLVSYLAFHSQIARARALFPTIAHTTKDLEDCINSIPEQPGAEAQAAIQRLNDWFFSLIDLDALETMRQSRNSHIDEFEPLRTIVGTNCDALRTKRFCQGVIDATRQLLSTRTGNVYVVDAGSGPFGLLGIVAAMQDPRVHVTLIELGDAAVETSRSIIRALDLESRVSVVRQDARDFVPYYQIDMLISETMDAGLFSEPILQIVSWLRNYVRLDGVVIPESVELEFGLRYRIDLIGEDDSFEAEDPTYAFMCFQRKVLGLRTDKLPAQLNLYFSPDEIPGKFDNSHSFTTDDLTIQTTVGVYGDHVLYPNTSVITRRIHPKKIDDYSQRGDLTTAKLNPTTDRSYSVYYNPGQGYEGRTGAIKLSDLGFCLNLLRAPIDR